MTDFSSMELGWHDAIGLSGVAMILYAYAMLQTDRWSKDLVRFSLVNLLGSLLILVSLLVDFNLASLVIELAWLAISAYGLYACWRRSRAT